MDRSDVVLAVTDRTGLTRAQAGAVIDAIGDVLAQSLRDGTTVKLGRIMTVQPVERAARRGRNPRTGEPLTIPARTVVKITPGSVLSQAIRS